MVHGRPLPETPLQRPDQGPEVPLVLWGQVQERLHLEDETGVQVQPIVQFRAPFTARLQTAFINEQRTLQNTAHLTQHTQHSH